MENTELPIGQGRLQEFTRILESYKAGKAVTEARIVSSENWWKLRSGPADEAGGFVSRSGWLHNVIVSKHADAVEAYPEPVILPREASDAPEARRLSAIVPCVLEYSRFEGVYSDAMWQKLKTGTGVYKVVWDPACHGGLGDIRVQRVNLLNIFWEPGLTDIQKSPCFFHTELVSRDALEEQYPGITWTDTGFVSTKFLYDDRVDTTDKVTVIEVYYRRQGLLHYCRYVGSTVLYATENDPLLACRGLYDHGKYPYVFDALFPIEGSPCGYGFVDLCRNPQTEIDMLKTAFLKNAMVGATPRYFARTDGAVNEEEFLDLSRPIVHVAGNLGDDSLKRLEHSTLDGVYVDVLQSTIDELRQTSGNTETATGTSSGVTAASAIAALQEASGKGSRDATLASYRAFSQVVELCIELIRQFYDLPRQFRILGAQGQEDYISYANTALKPQEQGGSFGCRVPVFDIRVSAQRHNAYARSSQNELALRLYGLGFFEAENRDKALQCLALMDFEGRQALMQSLCHAGTPPACPEGQAQDAEQATRGASGPQSAAPSSTDLARRQALEAPLP